MERESDTENKILRDFARIHLLQIGSSTEENLSTEEDMENEHNIPSTWTVPNRDERDLILAEEIIRFASITDRPPTSKVIRVIQAIPDSTSNTIIPDSKPIPENRGPNIAEDGDSTEFPVSQIDGREMPTASATTSRTMHIASEAGISGSKPPQSASVGFSQSLGFSFQDAFFPLGGAKVPSDPQSNPYRIRPDTIPVTNHILAAIAQSELERSPSSGPVILQPTSSAEILQDYTPKYNNQMFCYFLETLKNIQGSDLSRSSSPGSTAPTRSLSPSNDELTVFKQHLLRASEIEETMTKNIQKERDETLGDPAANQGKEFKGENDGTNTKPEDVIPQEKTPFADAVDNSANQQFDANPRENNVQVLEENNLNDNNAEALILMGSNEAVQSEFPDEDDTSVPEWTRPEKRRLGTVIRDLSREMKTKELQYRKARLLKKGRIIAQTIEKKICELNREIMAVNKRSLRHVALPLDQIQEYDWVKVATVLNAKRSPEDCRTYWKCFLHPTINAGEWTLLEVKAMEVIAQRHNFRNWDDIAEELNTGRSGYQCYTFYRKHLCPHLELRSDK